MVLVLEATRRVVALALPATAIVLIKPGLVTDLIGLACLATVLLSQQAFRIGSLPATADPPGE